MNTRKATILIAAVLAVGLLNSCDIFRGGTEIDEDIKSFVESEDLPEAQTPEVSFSDPNSKTKPFRVSFGEARDCPAGCFYSKAYGVKFRSRIGWMGLVPYGRDDTVKSKIKFFDVQAGDSTLFDPGFRDRFREATKDQDPDGYAPIYEAYLQMLGGDEETPTGTLNSLIDVLFEGYFPDVASALIENPVIRSNETLLERLTELPGDRYQPIREKAQELLDQMSEDN